MGVVTLLEQVRREKSPAVMAVLNVTPDSFSDGGLYFDEASACSRVDEVLAQGAQIIDIGSESTRPGAQKIDSSEQLRRALPVIRYAVKQGALVSIDTSDELVARAAADEGVALLNDVGCLRNLELAKVARDFQLPVIAMHSRGAMTLGSSAAMSGFSEYRDDEYGDVCRDIAAEWTALRSKAEEIGLSRGNIWFDPGLGFHKNAAHSLTLLARLHEFRQLKTVVVVGPSRKSFLGSLDQSGPHDRLGGTLAACVYAANSSDILRVHDVREVRQALLVQGELRRRSPAVQGPGGKP